LPGEFETALTDEDHEKMQMLDATPVETRPEYTKLTQIGGIQSIQNCSAYIDTFEKQLPGINSLSGMRNTVKCPGDSSNSNVTTGHVSHHCIMM